MELQDGREYVIGQDCITPDGVATIIDKHELAYKDDVWVRLKVSGIKRCYNYCNIKLIRLNPVY